MPRDASAPIPLPLDDGEARPRRSSAAPRTAAATPTRAEQVEPAAQGDGELPARITISPADVPDATERIRHPQVTVERVQVQRPKLTRRARRGASIAGALGLPLVSLGLIALLLPVVAWFSIRVIAPVAEALTGLLIADERALALGGSAAGDAAIALDAGSVWLLVAGGGLILVGMLLSWLVLRAHGVFRPVLVTLTAVPTGLGLAGLLQAVALTALVLQLGDGGAAGAVASPMLALLVLAAVVAIAVIAGLLVWRWMASAFRATVVTGVPAGGEG